MNAHRIVFIHEVMKIIVKSTEKIEFKPLSKYGLTRFFLLSCLSEMLTKDTGFVDYVKTPQLLLGSEKHLKFVVALAEVLGSMIIDLNYEVKQRGDNFDYKGDLKSPSKIRDLRAELLKSYEKELAKGKMKPISQAL